MYKLSRAWGAAQLALKANSPRILVVGGIVVMGAAAIVACKQTLKLEDEIEPEVLEIEEVNDVTSQPGIHNMDVYNKRKYKAYRGVAVKCGKLYVLPAGIFLLGAGMTFKGHMILEKRNAALALAFTALKRSFDDYRARVIAKHGDEWDQRLLNGEKWDEVDGFADKVVTRDWEASEKDPYNRVFSQSTSRHWQDDLGSNKYFLECQQRFAQERLNRRGYIYLSDIYEDLGFSESDISRQVGWKITTNEDGTRNVPWVDFGLNKNMPKDWTYNREKAVYLDFNCQGLIIGGKIQDILEKAARGSE